MHTVVTILITLMLLGVVAVAVVASVRILRPLLPAWLVDLVTQTAVPAVQRHSSAAFGRARAQLRARGNVIAASQTEGVQQLQAAALRGLYDEISTLPTDVMQGIEDRFTFDKVRSFSAYPLGYLAFAYDGDNPSRMRFNGEAFRITVTHDPTVSGTELTPLSYEPIDVTETFDDDENSITFTATVEQLHAARRDPHARIVGTRQATTRAAGAARTGTPTGTPTGSSRTAGSRPAQRTVPPQPGDARTRVLVDSCSGGPSSGYPCLRPTNGKARITLPTEGMLGRHPDPGSNDPVPAIVIDDEYVSSAHAWLSRRADTFVIKDLNSTNGIRVNGGKVTEAVLRHGDRVRLGSAEFLVLFRAPYGGQTERLA